MNTIHLNGRLIGGNQPCFITFEAGPTHDGLESALKLVSLAANAGADAIKFQIFDPDRLVSDKKQQFSYDILVDKDSGVTRTVSEPLYDILKRRSMNFDQWRSVKSAADELGLAFFATVGFEEDIDLLVELNCDSIKIASADVNHFPLISRAAKTGMVIQLDTGNATLGEVEAAVDCCLANGNDQIIIHQCPSGYPARLESIHLNMIHTLKEMFPFPVAFSDHTPGWEMDIAAVAMGASLVEKTITRDRTTPSVEHIFSLEADQLMPFIASIRDLEKAKGDRRRMLPQEQLQNRKAIRRSAYAATDIAPGTKLTEQLIEYRRPGYGIAPTDHDQLMAATTNQPIGKGEAIRWNQLTGVGVVK